VPELGALESAFADLSAGRGRSVLIEGEPGIGKSALLAAWLAGMAPSGVEVLRGACDELWGRFPLAVVAEALGLEVSLAGPLASLGGAPESIPSADPVVVAVERLLALVDGKTAQHPVVLVVEDLHWADEPSLLLWRRLNRAARQSPLLLIGTCRPIPRGEGLRLLRREVRGGGGLLLALESLPDTGVAALVERLAGGRPGPRLAARLEAAGGNPLYVIELIDAYGRAGATRLGDGIVELVPESALSVPAEAPVPARPDAAVLSLAGAIADRLDFLAPETRAVLRAAALLGTEFSVAELAAVLERRPVALLKDLEVATESGVLEPVGALLRFRHGLIRQALHEATPAPLRHVLVRQAAQALVKSGAPIERVAELLLGVPEAADGWELDWLAAHFTALTDRAPVVAADLLAHSLSLAPLDHPHRRRLEDGYAEAVFALARHDEVERVTTAVLRRGAEPERLGRASWLLSSTYLRTGRLAEGIAVVSDAAVLDRLDEVWRVRLRALYALELAEAGRLAEAEPAAEQALAQARAIRDVMAEAYSLHVFTVLSVSRDSPAIMLARCEAELAAIGGEIRLSDLEILAVTNRAGFLSVLDRFDEADAALREGRALAERLGSPRMVMVLMQSAFIGYFDGRWVEAQTDLEAISELPQMHEYMMPAQHGLLALILARRGETRAASRLLKTLRARFPDEGWQRNRFHRAGMAEAAIEEQGGRPGRALEILARPLPETTPESLDSTAWLPLLVRLALDEGERELAEQAAEMCARIAEHHQTPRTNGVAGWCTGMVTGDPDPLSSAADYYRQARRRSELGWVLEDAAVAYAQAGRQQEARAALAEALEVDAALGAEWDARRAKARLRRYGVRLGPRAQHRRARTGWQALTESEQRVAAMVATGSTNTDIAARLALSRRTVETHVSHVLAKLQVNSRREVGEAMRAAEA
jgi:DNA-binding CsgD family transcriptional regulator